MIVKSLKVGDIQANIDDDGDLLITDIGGRIVCINARTLSEFVKDLNTLVSEQAE
jgi:hypothetical protein